MYPFVRVLGLKLKLILNLNELKFKNLISASDKLMSEMGVDQKELWWYMETRKLGTCKHSGFGLGFERLMMFITGMKNIRDVIPFPRTPQNAEF